MMFKKGFVFCLLFCLYTTVFSQATDTITRYVDYYEKPLPKEKAGYFMKVYKASIDDSLWKREVFSKYVNTQIHSRGQSRDAEGMIKQGYYENYYDEGGGLLSAGYYENNERTGEWKWFHKNGNKQGLYHYVNGKMAGSNMGWYDDGKTDDTCMLDSFGNGSMIAYYPDGGIKKQGSLSGGIKKGKWEYFYKTAPHPKSMEVIFEKDSAISFTCFTEKGELQTKDCEYEREAAFKKGAQGWIKYLISRLEAADTYKYLGPKKKYTAIVKFIVTAEGKTSDVKIENPGIKGLDQIAIDIITMSPEWIPAIQFNQKVNAYRMQPVTFVTD